MEPIALIPELTKTLTKVSKGLAPWDRLVRLEEQLLRRARSAFMVHWFGTSVPVKRLNLHIVIRNIGDLRRRFERVRASMPTAPSGMSLLGPLSGMAGVVVGYILSPGGAVMLGLWMTEISEVIKDQEWIQWIILFFGAVGNWLVKGIALPIVGLIGLPVALLWSLGLAIGGSGMTRIVVELMHDLASLIDAGLILFDQIANRENTPLQNPLLRSFFEFLDKAAGFFAQLMGFAAIMAERILPMVPYLMTQFRAFWDLAMTLKDALADAVSGIVDAIKAPFQKGGGVFSILTHVYDSILAIPDALMEQMSDLLTKISADMSALFTGIKEDIKAYIGTVQTRVMAAFWETPFGELITLTTQLMRLLPRVIARIKRTYDTPGPPEPEDDEDLATTLREADDYWGLDWAADTPEAAADVLDQIDALTFPDLPDFTLPDMPQLPSLPSEGTLRWVRRVIGRAPEVEWSTEITNAFERARRDMPNAQQPAELLRRPRSVLTQERRAREARGNPTRTEADMRLRNALYLAVGRVLPGDLRVYAPQLRGYFDQLDQLIYGQPEAQPLEHPQLELPDSGRLQPRVQKLRIRARGAQAPDLRAFRDRVVNQLQNQSYRVQGAGAG